MSSLIQKSQAAQGLQNVKHVSYGIDLTQNNQFVNLNSGQIVEFVGPQITKPTLFRRVTCVPIIHSTITSFLAYSYGYGLKYVLSVANRELAEFLGSDLFEITSSSFRTTSNDTVLNFKSKYIDLLNLIPVLPNEQVKVKIIAPNFLTGVTWVSTLIYSINLIGTQEV